MRSLLFSISLLLLIGSSFSKKINPEVTNNLSEVDRLYYTCKIWGFLKYYHPKVGTGVFDWDEKLLTVLGNSQNIKTYDEFSTYMERWIYYMGQPKECVSCKQKKEEELFLNNFDLSWTQDTRFSQELRKTLANLEKNRFEGDHFYIGKGKAGQFEPKNEGEPKEFIWTDSYHRLLPLFRYWNYIEYFFPYKYQTDQNWDDVLKEFIPRFMQAENKLDFHLAMLKMVVKTDDSQSSFMTNLIDGMPFFAYLPVQIEIIENQVVVTKIIDSEKASVDDLKVGDVITTIDQQSAMALHDSHKEHIAGSNPTMKNRSISYTLFMAKDGSASISIERDGRTSSREVSLYKYGDLSKTKDQPKPSWSIELDTSWRKEITRVIDSNYVVESESLTDSSVSITDTTWIEETNWVVDTTQVGYLNLGSLKRDEVDDVMIEMTDTKAIILDVRNRPRGTYKALAKHLLPSENVFAKYIRPDFTYPGKYIVQGQSSCGETKTDSSWYQGKVILIVNEITQSSSEFTCMCFQTAPNVTVVGSQTAGTIGNGTRFPLLDGLYSTLTGTGVLYTDGSSIQRVGIVPDIVVNPTIQSIRDERDVVLEKAIEIALAD